MNRKEYKETLLKNNNEQNYVSDLIKSDYLKRLQTPYTKNGKTKCFYEQYSNGSGNELHDKFWSIYSSSRFAFEMYSWLAFDRRAKDIEFEFKLIGIGNSSRGVPNMDVFIELPDEIIFIESKLTECYKQAIDCDSLPGAYWKEIGDPDALTTDGKPLGSTLLSRYQNDSEALSKFINFINKFKDELDSLYEEKRPSCWMEFSQEIKHLYGIYFYLKKHPEFHNKKVSFFNIYFDLEDEINPVIPEFFREGQSMMNKLLEKFNVSFTYSPKTAQQVVKTFPDDIFAFDTAERLKNVLNRTFCLSRS